MKKQNKKVEKIFFDSIALNGAYELTSTELFDTVFRLFREYKITLKGKMLEAGCGTGTWGKAILKKYKQLSIIGVDIAKKMVKVANDGTRGYHAVTGDLENKSLFKKSSLDSIFCPAVLHHFPDPEIVFMNFSIWLKPNGIIVMVEPNGANFVGRISKLLRFLGESLWGNDFLLKTKLATPNEVDHTMKVYKKHLSKNNFALINSAFYYFEPPKSTPFSLGGMKLLLNKLFYKLQPKSKYTNTTVILIARKKK